MILFDTMDAYELLPGVVPASFLTKCNEKRYKKGEGFEIPKCFAQHEPILEYIAQHGWVLEGIVGKKKGMMVVKDVDEWVTNVEDEYKEENIIVPKVDVVIPKKEEKDLPRGVIEARAHADKVLDEMRSYQGVDWYDLRLKAIEYQDHLLLVEERERLQRRARFDTYDEMRLEELNGLLD